MILCFWTVGLKLLHVSSLLKIETLYWIKKSVENRTAVHNCFSFKSNIFSPWQENSLTLFLLDDFRHSLFYYTVGRLL